ncbi:hypothetical protein ACHAQE_007744 [Botrytis cinerea]
MSIWNCIKPAHASEHCSGILCDKNVAKIKQHALDFWEGMCIECGLRTSGGHNQQEQFWEDGRRKRYGTSCPIPHSYQTWNYSYMGPFELMSKHIAEQKEREKHNERTHKHGMNFSRKSGFPHASNSNSKSDSPKQSHRRSSMSFSTPDENSIQPQQQKLTERNSKKEAAKMKETETPPDPNRPRTQESTRSFKTSAPNTPRPNTPSRSACSTRFATLDETARLQQQKIAEWTARNLANKARIKEAVAEAEAEAESKTEEEKETEASTSSTDIYSGARFPEFPQLTKLEFHNHTDDHSFNPRQPSLLSYHPNPSPRSPPTNQAAPKSDWIAQRLAFYNRNREGTLAHQRMVNGESAMNLDDSGEEL